MGKGKVILSREAYEDLKLSNIFDDIFNEVEILQTYIDVPGGIIGYVCESSQFRGNEEDDIKDLPIYNLHIKQKLLESNTEITFKIEWKEVNEI